MSEERPREEGITQDLDSAQGGGGVVSPGSSAGSPATPGELVSSEGAPLRLVRVENFEPAEPVPAAHAEAFARRFSTLLLNDTRSRQGGLGQVTWAVNARGEAFAVKRPLPVQGTDAEAQAYREALEHAFAEEYEGHRRVSGLKGFPRLYGRGTVEGSPVLIMEWVEGETLEYAATRLAVDETGRLSPLLAARLTRDLFELLARMDLVVGGFAHRDVTPANVMICTALVPLASQIEEGVFDLRLIDFGSAAVGERRNVSLTEVWGAPRGATPDYAAPEMLTEDVAEAVAARAGTAVDVYAAAGVAYRLLTGCPPYDLKTRDVRSPYRRKTEDDPAPLQCAHEVAPDVGAVLAQEPEVAVALSHVVTTMVGTPDKAEIQEALGTVDQQINGLIEPCLTPKPGDRPTAAAVRDGLNAFCRQYTANLGHALMGEPLEPVVLGEGASSAPQRSRHWKTALRAGVYGLCGLIWLAVLVSAALVTNGIEVELAVGAEPQSVMLSGWLVALLLAVPSAVGYGLRGRKGGRWLGFGLGTVGLAGVSAVLAAGGLSVVTASPELTDTLMSALLSCAAAAWCPMTLDVALSPQRRKRQADASKAAAGQSLPSSSGTQGGGSAVAMVSAEDAVAALEEA